MGLGRGIGVALAAGVCTVTLGSAGPATLPAAAALDAGGATPNGAVLHVKFSAATAARVRNGQLVSVTGADVSVVADLLAQRRARIAPLFRVSEQQVESDLGRLRAAGEDVPDLNLWHGVSVDSDRAADALLAELGKLERLVDEAYVAPRPAPSPSGDYTGRQGYLQEAPAGIGASSLTAAGASGSRVKVVDVEYSWNQSHEDLSKAARALAANGTPIDPFGDNNHGTAVLGELVADNNALGVTGIVHAAELGLVNAFNLERGYDLANAIEVARAATVPGDVILIEQQTWGPNGAYVPVEWVSAFYDAITFATADGRIVVEAAGNGGQNLDDSQLFGKRFPDGRRDSGAIIVGAGSAPGCSSSPRSRLAFSTYGSRVDLQGWGHCVVSTGYGDLENSGVNSLYTGWFNGTSSASPIVAGAAAALSSAFEEETGRAAKPAHMRRVLKATGTPEVGNNEIGPLPNLRAALARLNLD